MVYVWIDALTNYITALDYGENSNNFKSFWPADVQLVGKEITRFHVIYWPMILMALDLPMPKQIFSHGWLLMESDKMSKSKGNVIYPDFLIENYGSDSLRYYLMREVPFGSDGQFTPDTFINRINNDIVNDFANLVNRTVVMANKYFDGTVVSSNLNYAEKIELREHLKVAIQKHKITMENLEFSKNLENSWGFISKINKFIDLTTPWVLIGVDNEKLNSILFELLNSIKNVIVFITPYVPKLCIKACEQINVMTTMGIKQLEEEEPSFKVAQKPSPLYMRLDPALECEKIKMQMKKQHSHTHETKVSFEDTSKYEVKVGLILSCESHKETKRLLISRVDVGNKILTIVSGFGQVYTSKEL
ncbi:MAG: class I tRNA ligase family protein, partial [Spiroplasma sp.]|nr:class I tRNA ligase family protein [Mycoplasmatales bacterium]